MSGSKNSSLGLVLAIVGTFCSAVGYTFQKLAHRRADVSRSAAAAAASASAPAGSAANKPAAAALPFWRFWQLSAGFAALVLGSVTAVFAFGLAGQAELAPMGAVTLIWTEVLAALVLREAFTRVDALAVALMSCGTILALVFADKSNLSYSLDGILALLNRPVVYAYTTVVAAGVAAAAVAVAQWGRYPPAALSRAAFSADAFCRAFIGGVFGGWTGALVKALVEVLFGSLGGGGGGGSPWARPEPYVALVLLAGSLTLQLGYMNSGLARYEANRIIPIYQCSLVFAGVASGPCGTCATTCRRGRARSCAGARRACRSSPCRRRRTSSWRRSARHSP